MSIRFPKRLHTGYPDEFQYCESSHRCDCGAKLLVALGTKFHRCDECGFEGYEVPTA